MGEVLACFNNLPVPSTAQLAWLISEGVPPAAIASDDVPVVASILPGPDGIFDFAEGDCRAGATKPAILFLHREPDGTPTDLIGWLPRAGWLGSWMGHAAFLGDPLGPRLNPIGALSVWRSPWGWLRAGRDGVVIINPVRAAYRIHDLGPILAEDPAHAAEIERAFRLLLPALFTRTLEAEAA